MKSASLNQESSFTFFLSTHIFIIYTPTPLLKLLDPSTKCADTFYLLHIDRMMNFHNKNGKFFI